MSLTQAIKQFTKAQQRLQAELHRITDVSKALDSLGREGRGRGTVGNGRRRPRRKMTAAGRARIAAAQKTRWSKAKSEKKQVRGKHRRKS